MILIIIIIIAKMMRFSSKSVGFFFKTAGEKEIIRYQNIRQRLIKYPYAGLKRKIQDCEMDSPDIDDFLHQNIIKDHVAFASLRQFHHHYLQCNYSYIFNQSPPINNLTGNIIFSQYFKTKLGQIRNVLNGSNNNQQISYNLKILFYLKLLINSEIKWPQFNLQQIEKSDIFQHKAYLLQIYEDQPAFLQFLQKFANQLSLTNDKDQVQAALVLLSITNFQQKMPQKLSQYCIEKLSQKVQQMNVWELYRIVENIFSTNYLSTKNYIQNLTTHIIKLNQQQQQQKYVRVNAPLIMKVVKIREKLEMNNVGLQKVINANLQKFKHIFYKQKKKKLPILRAIATNKTLNILPEQIQTNLYEYAINFFQKTILKNQCNLQAFIQCIKLCLKYANNFRLNQIAMLQQKIEKSLLPMFHHENQVQYWLILLLIRLNKQKIQKNQIKDIINKLLNYFHSEYMAADKQISKHLNLQKIIQLYYHLIRTNSKIHHPKQLLSYDFIYITTFQTTTLANFIISKINLQPFQKYQLFKRMIKQIQFNLDQKRYDSMKTFFLVLNALHCSKCKESQNYSNIGFLYQKIQTFLMESYSSHQPRNQELLYIRKVFIQNRYDESTKKKVTHNYNFLNFIDQCIRFPQNWKNNHNQYMKAKYKTQKTNKNINKK